MLSELFQSYEVKKKEKVRWDMENHPENELISVHKIEHVVLTNGIICYSLHFKKRDQKNEKRNFDHSGFYDINCSNNWRHFIF